MKVKSMLLFHTMCLPLMTMPQKAVSCNQPLDLYAIDFICA